MTTTRELIQRETNPEILRELALFIHDQADFIAAENKILRAERKIEAARKQEWLNQEIRAQLHKLQRRLFDKGRESLGDLARPRDTKEDQLLLHAMSLTGEPTKKESKNLPITEQEHFATEEQLIADAKTKDTELTSETATVTEMKDFFETSSEITVTERTYTRTVHKRQKYKVKNTETGQETIVTAPGPLKLSPGCRFSLDFALSIVADKFLNHMPYERQKKEMARLGLDASVMTMFRLSEQVMLHLKYVAREVREDILKAALACHLDETHWPIQDMKEAGRMWILSNQAGSYYQFEPTRSGQVADELLKNYSGAVLTDKYSGYLHFRNLKNITWGLCWAHSRREFFDLLEIYPIEITKVVNLIDDLFAIERKARTWDELKKLREVESVKKLEEIKNLLHEYQAQFFSEDAFCKAIHYVLSAWAEFTAFTKDIQLPLSNNDAERALRHAVLGRKNFYGSKTINGADTAAILYTIIESCKKAQLDPIAYIKYVIIENQSDRKPLSPLNYAKKMNLH